MNGKQLLALLLTASVSAAALSIAANGDVSGPAPNPADLPTANAWTESEPVEPEADAVESYDAEADTMKADAEAESVRTYAAQAETVNAYAAQAGAVEAESVETDTVTQADASAAAQYDTVTGQWTLAELAAMDAPPVIGDPQGDAALERQWRALRDALINAPPDSDPDSVLSAALESLNAAGEAAPSADGKAAPSADGPALTGDPVADAPIIAEWNAAHPAPEVPETPESVTNPADTPEAALIAGPDDGGARPERKLDKNEERDAKKREQIVQSATEQTEVLSEISFAEVESRTREDNMTVRALRESAEGLENMDYEKAQDDLVKVLNGLSMQQDMLGFAANEPIAQSFAVSSLQSQYDSLYSSLEQLRDGTTRRSSQDAIEQMRNAMNQVVMGAETLYIALVAMENQYGALSRQLDALNRTVEEMELRYSLGQISALTLNQAKSGRTALLSGMETLQMNIRTYKMQLENMLGASLTGKIKLGKLPAVTEAQITALDADRDFSAAHDKSYELYAAARTLQDAKETFQNSGEQYRYNESNSSYEMARRTWVAAQDTYNVTVRGYELKFRTLYEQVHDYYQVWNASKDALEAQKLEYQAKELQYKQGNISKNTLLSAKDTLSEKEEAVQTAANNLFSAYNNYCWAAQTGILN